MNRKIKLLYSKIRQISPSYLNGILGKSIFVIKGKPIAKLDHIDPNKKFPNKEKGGLIISADFEMAWAWRYTKTGNDHIKKGQIERANFPRIIKILDEFNIPITFAAVGHLFLEKCSQGEHDWMYRIPHFNDHWKFTEGDWYDHDPYSDFKKAPEWYAPDLIKMILESKVKHEIGTHTFSHIDFSDKNCPPKAAEDEIIACKDAAKIYGIKIESIVFPGGTWGNLEMLKKHSIKIYRKRNEFDITFPYRDQFGILVTTSSGALEYNLNYGWSANYYISRLKKIVSKAIRTNTIAHLWFHPSLDPFILDNILPKFFKFAVELREKGDLWIGPMNKIANHINENKIL